MIHLEPLVPGVHAHAVHVLLVVLQHRPSLVYGVDDARAVALSEVAAEADVVDLEKNTLFVQRGSNF